MKLTARELEVCRMLAKGKRPCDIAAALNVTQATVNQHTTAARRKLACKSTFELAVKVATMISESES